MLAEKQRNRGAKGGRAGGGGGRSTPRDRPLPSLPWGDAGDGLCSPWQSIVGIAPVLGAVVSDLGVLGVPEQRAKLAQGLGKVARGPAVTGGISILFHPAAAPLNPTACSVGPALGIFS